MQTDSYYFSESKGKFIPISKMHPMHLQNVIKKMRRKAKQERELLALKNPMLASYLQSLSLDHFIELIHPIYRKMKLQLQKFQEHQKEQKQKKKKKKIISKRTKASLKNIANKLITGFKDLNEICLEELLISAGLSTYNRSKVVDIVCIILDEFARTRVNPVYTPSFINVDAFIVFDKASRAFLKNIRYHQKTLERCFNELRNAIKNKKVNKNEYRELIYYIINRVQNLYLRMQKEKIYWSNPLNASLLTNKQLRTHFLSRCKYYEQHNLTFPKTLKLK